MSRVVVTFLIGGAAGFASSETINYFSKKTKSKNLAKYDLQKKMGQQLHKNYEPTQWDWNWDGRNEAFQKMKDAQKAAKAKLKNSPQGTDLESKKDINNNTITTKDNLPKLSTATRHIMLIRHGQYNTAGENDKHHTLTKNGVEQAICTGKQLNDTKFPYSILMSSTMTRAQETADLIQAQLTIPAIHRTSTDLLREGAPFPPEPPIHSWKPDHKQFLEDGTRIEEAFKSLIHRADVEQKNDSFEIVVCHANVIRYIVCRAMQLPPEAWLRMSLQHASVTWLAIKPSGRVILRSFGDGGHIPLDLKTFS